MRKLIQYMSSTSLSKTGILFVAYKVNDKIKRKSFSWRQNGRTHDQALALAHAFINTNNIK